MLTYQFECEECNKEVELRYSITEYSHMMRNNRTPFCPALGCGGKMKRTIKTAARVLFKGEGWPDKKVEAE